MADSKGTAQPTGYTPATSAFVKAAAAIKMPTPAAAPAGASTDAATNRAPFKKFQSAVSRVQTFTVTVFRLPEQLNSGQPAKEDKSSQPIDVAVPNSPAAATAATGVASIMMKATDVVSFRLETTLAQIRSALKVKSKIQGEFRFCNEVGAVVADDSCINDYFTSLAKRPAMDDISFKLYITGDAAPAEPLTSVLTKPPFTLKFIRIENGTEKTVGTLHSGSMKDKNPSALVMGEVRKLIKDMSVNPEIDQFCIADGTPVGEGVSLTEYLEMTDVQVVRERTPIIPILYHSTARPEKPRFHGASEEVKAAMEKLRPDLSFTDRSAEELKADREALAIQEELDAAKFAVSGASVKTYTSAMTERDWASVLRNCNLMYGWRIDFAKNVLEKAPKAAFQLRQGLNLPPVPPAPAKIQPRAVEAGDRAASGDDKAEPNNQDQDEENPPLPADQTPAQEQLPPSEPPVTSAKEISEELPAKVGAIPSFQINDRSKIEVVSVVHQFQESMATNHFSKSSLEVGVSGGWAGNSVGVTAGVASSSSDSQKQTEKATQKRMLASYKFPRVTVFLHPDNLEPTEELKNAIKRIQKTKNINDLRKLRADFGHLFVQQAVLGGCLQTTKVTDAKEKSTEEKSKDEFKAEVGVAVQTAFGVGGSVKASHETQDGKEHVQSNLNQRETMSFEATGGNTLLASNPSEWCASVGDFNNWRVIDQSELVSMVDVIAQHPSCTQVKQWFMQAVPKLSEYLVVPDSRTLDVRFKLAANTPTMAKIVGSEIPAYLGHDPLHPPVPRKTAITSSRTGAQIKESVRFDPSNARMVVDMTTFCVESKLVSKDAIFFPSGTQAPVLFQPTEYQPLDANGDPEPPKAQGPNEPTSWDKVGTIQDEYLKHTLWSLEIPHGESIGHDSLVCISSQNNDTSATKRCVLTVYRNAQGVFLPAISSTDEPSYWRIIKAQGATTEQLKSGEEIRLCWQFSDQPGGYRDYTQDCYGRRQRVRPADVPVDRLYLKVPFPSFGGGTARSGLGLVLSTCALTEPVWEGMRTLKPQSHETETVMYNLHDLTFRLDTVGNNGLGDSRDYMNHVTAAHLQFASTITHGSTVSKPIEVGGPIDLLGGVLLGPVVKASAAIVDTFVSWLGW
ncbi:uncharacterized protein Aud_002450 [Aspergillus udagawae]|uniref:MACPF-like domain-containing protein n=1 Tax=Aspergillus udagawae TaxID=91492 RepID=A0A8E0QKM4_9EURO|nr:uncharacterized protein Aud_002450 [Aspergillus udagawae]GIC86088.1 hypothetical protein Aud_002450 [Aspergillus udagawae]